jgi:hypothetical protein
MTVAYDSAAIFGEVDVGVKTRPAYVGRSEFRRLERIVVLVGGAAVGGAVGFVTEIAIGRPSLAVLVVSGAVFTAFALYLCSQTLRESLVRRAYGCTAAAVIQAAALLAWPLTALFAPVSPLAFWLTPLIAISSLVLFASCWDGPPRAIYRLSLQGALVAGLAAYQGALVMMAG